MPEERLVFHHVPYTPRMRQALGLDNELERYYLSSPLGCLQVDPHRSDWTTRLSPQERVGVPTVDVVKEYHGGTLTYIMQADDGVSLRGLASQIELTNIFAIALVKLLDTRELQGLRTRL